MCSDAVAVLDLDHVVMNNGRIYRVVGNLDSRTHFLGYNVYSPSADGDRRYRGEPYRKNFIEDEDLPADVLSTYELLAVEDIAEHRDCHYHPVTRPHVQDFTRTGDTLRGGLSRRDIIWGCCQRRQQPSFPGKVYRRRIRRSARRHLHLLVEVQHASPRRRQGDAMW